MPVDRRVNGAAGGVGVSLDQRAVALVDGAFLERALECRVGPLALGHDHRAGRADVEAVHDALPLRRARRGDAVAHRRQALDDCRAHPARARMRSHAHWLVHHHEVVVVVKDAQPVDRFGLPGRRRRPGW